METARVLKLVCVFFCIVSLIRTIKANNNIDEEINYDDEYWANKTNEARKHTLLAYHPDPYDIVDHFHERHYDNSSDVEEAKAAAEEDMIDMISSSLTTNSTRRSLSGTHHRRGKRGKWSKLKGPCTASNSIDKCWRCQPHWARRRKKLADCVRGFGYRTTGGKSGRIYVVTSNKDDDMVNPKQGTLRHAVIQKEPLWIIFKNDMHIRLSQELMINSHKTIDARGAKVHIAYGAGITIQYVQNIIIHGLRIHHIIKSSGGLIRDTIEHFGLRGEADGDGITIFGATNVWLDHISMSKCQDGLIDAVMGSTGITISNSHFTHHNDVMLLGAQNDNKDDKKMQVTVAFNHFGKGLVQRMPRIRWGFVHVVNNDYTHWELYAIGGSQAPTILSHGNRFIAPPHKLHCNEVTKRDYASEGEWKNWNWRSEKDIFMNKAYFRQSGNPHFKCSHSRQQMIKPKHGLFVSKLTKYAGALDCRLGKAC